MAAGEYREFRAGSKPQRLSEEFDAVLDAAAGDGWNDQLNCHEFPERYVDYDEAPTKARAAWLCEGCPLRTLCKDYARATKPGWGVWGGEAWRNGKRVGADDTPEKELVD